jgi:hypothetical protein
MIHDDVAAYWYDTDHLDCTILRQGDVFENFLADHARTYLVVVSQSCDLRKDPSADITLAGADPVYLWLAENGVGLNQLETIRKGEKVGRLLLPRRPGFLDDDVLVFLNETIRASARDVCVAVEAGRARARATEILSWFVAHNIAYMANRPAVRVPVPDIIYKQQPHKVEVEPFKPGSSPFSTRDIPLEATRWVGKEGTARSGETFYQVSIAGERQVMSAHVELDAARYALAVQVRVLLAQLDVADESEKGLMLKRVRATYF